MTCKALCDLASALLPPRPAFLSPFSRTDLDSDLEHSRLLRCSLRLDALSLALGTMASKIKSLLRCPFLTKTFAGHHIKTWSPTIACSFTVFWLPRKNLMYSHLLPFPTVPTRKQAPTWQGVCLSVRYCALKHRS